MTLESNAKFKKKVIFGLKNDMRNLANIHQRTQSLIIGTFMASFCPKLKMYELKIYRGVISWQWKMMQKVQRNWLVGSKLTWGIWRILTWALKNLKNLHFNWLLWTKVNNICPKKVQRSYIWWHWILMQNLKENWFVL